MRRRFLFYAIDRDGNGTLELGELETHFAALVNRSLLPLLITALLTITAPTAVSLELLIRAGSCLIKLSAACLFDTCMCLLR